MAEPEQEREGFRAWLGVLSAFKDAIDETIDEIRQRGDVSPERAKEAVRKTMRRAHDAVEEARDRLDMVPRKEFDALRGELDELARRVSALEQAGEQVGSAADPAAQAPPGDS